MVSVLWLSIMLLLEKIKERVIKRITIKDSIRRWCSQLTESFEDFAGLHVMGRCSDSQLDWESKTMKEKGGLTLF